VTSASEKGTREEYLAYLRAVVDYFKIDVRTFHHVKAIDSQSDGSFSIEARTLSGLGRHYRASDVVLATGGTAACRRLGVSGEDLPHVHRRFSEPHRYHGRRLLIVGGRNSACDAAVFAQRCGADVTLVCRGEGIHPRVKYWIRPELEAMIKSGQVRALFHTEVVRIDVDNVVLSVGPRQEILEVPADDVFLALGFTSDGSLFEMVGAELDGEARSVVHEPSTMRTTVPGVFVAGTAVAGTQARFKVYIENSHIHAKRIAAALTGDSPPDEPEYPLLPES
jgi:thioredoxin reductase (NADPH)